MPKEHFAGGGGDDTCVCCRGGCVRDLPWLVISLPKIGKGISTHSPQYCSCSWPSPVKCTLETVGTAENSFFWGGGVTFFKLGNMQCSRTIKGCLEPPCEARRRGRGVDDHLVALLRAPSLSRHQHLHIAHTPATLLSSALHL